MIIDPKKIIINSKHKQTTGQRAVSIVLLLVLWSALIYFVRQLIVVGSWMLSYFLYQDVAGGENGFHGLANMMLGYLPMIVGMIVLFLGWAFYNKLRFQGFRDKRRSPIPPLEVSEIAEGCLLEVKDITDMRQATIMTCYFDEEGVISGVGDFKTVQPSKLRCQPQNGDSEKPYAFIPKVALDLA